MRGKSPEQMDEMDIDLYEVVNELFIKGKSITPENILSNVDGYTLAEIEDWFEDAIESEN